MSRDHQQHVPDAAAPQLVHHGPGVQVTRDDIRGCPVLAVSGEIDLSNAAGLAQTITATATATDLRPQRPPGPVVIDMTEVRFLSAGGVAALVCAVEDSAHRGQPLRIVINDSHVLLRSLRLARFEQDLALYDSVDTAVRAAA